MPAYAHSEELHALCYHTSLPEFWVYVHNCDVFCEKIAANVIINIINDIVWTEILLFFLNYSYHQPWANLYIDKNGTQYKTYLHIYDFMLTFALKLKNDGQNIDMVGPTYTYRVYNGVVPDTVPGNTHGVCRTQR